MSFPHRLFSLPLIAILALPMQAMAQTKPDPTADLATIKLRAENDPSLQSFLQRVLDIRSGPEDRRRRLEAQLFQTLPNGSPSGAGPIPYRASEQVQNAQIRVQILSRILTADLDGDGSITTQEVKDTLRVTSVDGAAEAFFMGDANNDDILSPEEIRAAANQQLSKQGRRIANPDPMVLFDFDDDGILSVAERERGIAALDLTGN